MAIKRLDIQTTQRAAIKRGPFNADMWNSTINELTTDLANLALQWNQLLVPLLKTVPDGTLDSAVNGYINGLDGRTCFVDWQANTTPLKIRYYHIGKQRPKTIKEALDDLYTFIGSGGDVNNTTIINGGLTDEQKRLIGDRIFDGSPSDTDSIDFITHANALNIEQIAKDLYGPSWVLNNNGTPILTNSVQAMVHALLLIHNGSWSGDITVNHDGIGGTSTLAGAYNAGSSSAHQTLVIANAKGGGVIIDGIVDDGTWTGTDPLTVTTGITTTGGQEKTLSLIARGSTPLSTTLTNSAHLSLTSKDASTNEIKDIIQLQESPFSGGASAAGIGAAVGFGATTTGGLAGGYKGMGRVGAVLIDPVSATLTSAIVLASVSENGALPNWDNGANIWITGGGNTTNATPLEVMSIPIPNSTIRVFQGIVKINATTTDGLNMRTWKFDFSGSTAITPLSTIDSLQFDAGTSTTWVAAISYASGNIVVTVTGAASTNIKWKASMELFITIA